MHESWIGVGDYVKTASLTRITEIHDPKHSRPVFCKGVLIKYIKVKGKQGHHREAVVLTPSYEIYFCKIPLNEKIPDDQLSESELEFAKIARIIAKILANKRLIKEIIKEALIELQKEF